MTAVRAAVVAQALLLVLLGCAAFGALGVLLGGTLRAEIVLAAGAACLVTARPLFWSVIGDTARPPWPAWWRTPSGRSSANIRRFNAVILW